MRDGEYYLSVFEGDSVFCVARMKYFDNRRLFLYTFCMLH